MLEISLGNLDLTQLKNDHIKVTWQMKAPIFTIDFDV